MSASGDPELLLDVTDVDGRIESYEADDWLTTEGLLTLRASYKTLDGVTNYRTVALYASGQWRSVLFRRTSSRRTPPSGENR